MKYLIWILPLFLILIAICPIANAQNKTNSSSGNSTDSASGGGGGGLSTKSVDIAKSNTKNLIVNSSN
ncbi:MAG: hypothetical protein ABJB76_09440 [Candidatus Nitrosocosmicus sp.]